jgi:hypothetical protein
MLRLIKCLLTLPAGQQTVVGFAFDVTDAPAGWRLQQRRFTLNPAEL